MDVSEVRVRLADWAGDKLLAFATVVLGGELVVRDLRVIDGPAGPFVTMPHRKLHDKCPCCRSKNHLKARFCNQCGARIDENRTPPGPDGRVKLHADVVHPTNSATRRWLEAAVLAAYRREVELAKSPDYRDRYEYEGVAR